MIGMKTIRLRNRALILLVLCTVGVVLLMKGLGDDSPHSELKEKLKNPKSNYEILNSKDEDKDIHVGPPQQPIRAKDHRTIDVIYPDNKKKQGNGVAENTFRNRKDDETIRGHPINPPIRRQQHSNQESNNFPPPGGDRAEHLNEQRQRHAGQVPKQNINYPDFGIGKQPGHRNTSGKHRSRLEGAKDMSSERYPLLVNGKFIPGARIVHFDLKGAAPKVAYFKEVFEMLKNLGATGVLLEWEDMFPFKGRLAAVRNAFAYSEADVKQILGWAKDFGLDIIPLVQTFGHLEYILKLPQFSQYRQVDRYPQVICMGNEEAVRLVEEAVDQVMSIHSLFPLSYFHIGADEAFQIGMCEADQKVMREELQNSREKLMLRHIARISKYVKKKGAKVLMWHDMLNNLDSATIREFDLGNLAEPVVWAYAENLNEYLMPDMWARFGEVFPYIWGASSFKGADGPSRYWSNVPHYLANHLSWTEQMTREYRNYKEFRGLILTGWQRFDHFALLCEILPVGLPSAAINLQVIKRGAFDLSAKKEASRVMGCSSTFDVDSTGVGAYCTFPGAKVYQAVQQLKMTLSSVQTNVHEDYQIQGWLSRFNIKHSYSSPWYLDQIMDKIAMYQQDLQSIERNLREELSKIFFPDMVDEFLYEYVEPELDKLNEMSTAAKRISNIRTFPLRPFPIKGSTSQWSDGAKSASKNDDSKLN